MLGAIIGNIAGSIYFTKGNRIKTKDFIFFNDFCHFRIDSVCTAAVADILLNDLQPARTMQQWCRRYPKLISGKYKEWVDSDTPKPYNSFGNGAAMRVSPAAFLNRGCLNAALSASDRVTKITHNHPNGIKGARATTHAIWLAYQGENADSIREVIASKYDYDLTRPIDEIRPDYSFDLTCEGTVPQAITCALESKSFDDAVRNAISLGGDADTLAAIAGPIAEALYDIPATIKQQTENQYLAGAPDILVMMREMYRRFDEKNGRVVPLREGDPIKCPNCDPQWKLASISHRFVHRYGYRHQHNEFAPSPDSMKYRIVEPDPNRKGWIRMVNIDGTNRAFRQMRYSSNPLDSNWQYHRLNCGCETVILPDLKEIPKM